MRLFSGIQPSGAKHLGNLLGAIDGYVDGGARAQAAGGEAIIMVADVHATTVSYDPSQLRQNVYDTTALLIAAGVNPEQTQIFRQSDIMEHGELHTLLGSVCAHGDLNRQHQFHSKSAKARSLATVGLFTYPLLQAADVLLYRATEVPVGEDQRQHLNLMREVARSFNRRFGDTFPVPEHRIPQVAGRIMDLADPTSKMSTTGGTEAGTLTLLDSEANIRKKIKRATADNEGVIRYAPKEQPGISNLIEILAACTDKSIEQTVEELADARGYGDLKAVVGDAVCEKVLPIQERYQTLRADEDALEDALCADTVMGIAENTMGEVRERMGLGMPRRR